MKQLAILLALISCLLGVGCGEDQCPAVAELYAEAALTGVLPDPARVAKAQETCATSCTDSSKDGYACECAANYDASPIPGSNMCWSQAPLADVAPQGFGIYVCVEIPSSPGDIGEMLVAASNESVVALSYYNWIYGLEYQPSTTELSPGWWGSDNISVYTNGGSTDVGFAFIFREDLGYGDQDYAYYGVELSLEPRSSYPTTPPYVDVTWSEMPVTVNTAGVGQCQWMLSQLDATP